MSVWGYFFYLKSYDEILSYFTFSNIFMHKTAFMYLYFGIQMILGVLDLMPLMILIAPCSLKIKIYLFIINDLDNTYTGWLVDSLAISSN